MNSAVLCVKDDWKVQFRDLRYCLSKLSSLLKFFRQVKRHTVKPHSLTESVQGAFDSQIAYILNILVLCWTNFGKEPNKRDDAATNDDSPFLLCRVLLTGNPRFFPALGCFSSNWRRCRVIYIFRPALQLPLPTRFIIRIVCLEAAPFILWR